jgi:hypothetical protein
VTTARGRKPAGSAARGLLTALAGIHVAVAGWHGAAHEELGVALSSVQTLFVWGVVAHLPAGSAAAREGFVRSASLLAVVELAGAVGAGVILARQRGSRG